MSDLSFHRMFAGEFKFTGSQYPEARKDWGKTGIFKHDCKCGVEYQGYKHRAMCCNCQKLEDKVRGDL